MKPNLARAITWTSHILDAWLPWKIRYSEIPGLSVGIVFQHKLAYARGFGLADIARKMPAEVDTRYRVASISKMFTAVAVLQLIEQKKLRLSDPVHRHLPWFHARSGKKEARRITVAQLLSHASGIFRDGSTPHWSNGRFPGKKLFIRDFSRDALIFSPREHFKYSNYGFGVLGFLIEKIAGLTYEEYISRYILTPLKMGQTLPDFSGRVPLLATGYGRIIPGLRRIRFPHVSTNAYAPATGLISTVKDLGIFLSSLTPQRSAILRPASSRIMQRAWMNTKDEEEELYGLGLSVKGKGAWMSIGHGGGFAGFSTQARYFPAHDLGVVVLSNALNCPAPNIATGVVKLIRHFAEKPALYHPRRTPSRLSRFEGNYRGIWEDALVVRAGNGLVFFSPQLNWPSSDLGRLRWKNGLTFVKEGLEGWDSEGEQSRFVQDSRGRIRGFMKHAGVLRRVRL